MGLDMPPFLLDGQFSEQTQGGLAAQVRYWSMNTRRPAGVILHRKIRCQEPHRTHDGSRARVRRTPAYGEHA